MYIHIMVNSHQLPVQRTVGLSRELYDQSIAARYGKPTCSTMAIVPTVTKVEHHDVVSSVIFAHQFPEKHPCEWNNQALITLEEATEVYMVEVMAKSHCYKQKCISCRFSICQRLWQGKEVWYSGNSRTCALHWIWWQWPTEGFCEPQ